MDDEEIPQTVENLKRCSDCGEEKTLDLFGRLHGEPRRNCKACHNAQHRANNQKNRSRRSLVEHRSGVKRKYGVTPAEYDAMLESQGGVCKICKQPESAVRKDGGLRRLAVDHCHSTGKVRRLLCIRCNTGIGYFMERPDILRLAADYLESHHDG